MSGIDGDVYIANECPAFTMRLWRAVCVAGKYLCRTLTTRNVVPSGCLLPVSRCDELCGPQGRQERCEIGADGIVSKRDRTAHASLRQVFEQLIGDEALLDGVGLGLRLQINPTARSGRFTSVVMSVRFPRACRPNLEESIARRRRGRAWQVAVLGGDPLSKSLSPAISLGG